MIGFEWDSKKAQANLKKHGIEFNEAITVFADPLEITISDPVHSHGEYRFISIGKSDKNNFLVISFIEPFDNHIRVISARLATKKERRFIMNNNTKVKEMQTEYDFSNGVQGKHHKAYAKGTNVILLDADVMKHFKDSQSVNHALRMLINLAENEISTN